MAAVAAASIGLDSTAAAAVPVALVSVAGEVGSECLAGPGWLGAAAAASKAAAAARLVAAGEDEIALAEERAVFAGAHLQQTVTGESKAVAMAAVLERSRIAASLGAEVEEQYRRCFV